MPHPAVRQPHSTAVTLHFRERQNKQPLYRPAALRRNGSVQRDLFMHPSPPHSPSLAAATETKSPSWLSTLAAPFSPVSHDSSSDTGAAYVRGRMLPRSQWKPDDDAEHCADPDCSLKFDLINRRHHCRTCGDVFCAAHSSRSTLLWPSSEDDSVPAFTPRGTPRATPRSSAVDLPSLASYSVSPSNASAISTASTSSTPTSSSPPPSQTNLMPVSARVCDRCYFSAPNPSGSPTPLLTPPVLAHPLAPYSAFGNAAFAGARPVTLRHPRSRASSASRASSPAHSPPNSHAHGAKASSRSRSRQGSATSTSSLTATSEYSTPSTSVEGLAAYGSASTDGTSPESLVIPPKHAHGRRKPQPSLSRNPSASRLAAAGSRGVATPKVVREDELLSDSDREHDGEDSRRASDGLSNASAEVEDGPPRLALEEEDSDEDDERHERTVKERRRLQQEFGSVQGGPWQSWATF
ncbi:zinc finger, FYVE-type protein [Rhodotorula toruloides]|uniref:Zinc finger, FYVE-type protein n=1 Tax=Rhodotorula toruloides TaxID=5286 RepID=A0A511KJF9_RHOTO|nr:zinc finger, FYVE-type protein [Rhodotorula toruloides]